MRIALVRDGRVSNVIEADADFVPEAGTLALPAGEAGPGWLHEDGVLRRPPEDPGVPPAVSMFQAREALRRTLSPRGGTLLEAIDAYVESHRIQQPTLALAWEYATRIERDSVLVAALASHFGLDGPAIDRIFQLAATIDA
jgi:hypothetical protein